MPRSKKIQMTDEMNKRLSQMLEVLNAELNAYYAKHWPRLRANLVYTDRTRYILIRGDGIGSNYTGSFMFIDKLNGDILKSATFRAPAKHARGNLLAVDWLLRIGPYGPEYLINSGNYKFFPDTTDNVGKVDIAKDALLEWRTAEAIEILKECINITPYNQNFSTFFR